MLIFTNLIINHLTIKYIYKKESILDLSQTNSLLIKVSIFMVFSNSYPGRVSVILLDIPLFVLHHTYNLLHFSLILISFNWILLLFTLFNLLSYIIKSALLPSDSHSGFFIIRPMSYDNLKLIICIPTSYISLLNNKMEQYSFLNRNDF